MRGPIIYETTPVRRRPCGRAAGRRGRRPNAGDAAKPVPPPRLFLSPSGEPFRLSSDLPDPLKGWFDRVDANHDGVIDRFEFRADAAAFFKTLDENGDGMIDGFEVADYESKIAPELAEQAEGRMPGQFGPRPRGRRSRTGRIAARPAGTEPHREEHDDSGGERGRGSAGIAQLIDEPEPVSGGRLQPRQPHHPGRVDARRRPALRPARHRQDRPPDAGRVARQDGRVAEATAPERWPSNRATAAPSRTGPASW